VGHHFTWGCHQIPSGHSDLTELQLWSVLAVLNQDLGPEEARHDSLLEKG